MEETDVTHYCPGAKRSENRILQSLHRPLRLACPAVLSCERSHRLHEGTRHQHDESTYFLRHAYAGRSSDAEHVDNRLNHQEGNTDQKVLDRNRDSDLQNL